MCIERILILGMLAVNSVRDIRKREIFFLPTVLFGAAGCFYRFFAVQENWAVLLLSLLPGLLFLGLALLLPEQAGIGDAWMILAAGTWMQPEEMLVLLCVSLFAASIAAAVLFLQRKQKTTLPFIPFLLAGGVISFLLFL